MGAVSPLNPLVAALTALGVALVVLALLLVRSRRELARTRRAATTTGTAVSRRLAGVMASGRDGIVLHGAGGKVLEVNEAAAALLGATSPALVGRAVTELPVRWRSETGQEVAPAAVFARRSEAWGEGVVLAVEPVGGGPQRWVQVWTRAVPTVDGGQELTTWLADVSGRREALAAQARSEQQFQAAMEYAPIGMVLIDTQWRLTRVNAAFASLLGARPEALVGRDLSALSHPDDRAAERAGVHGLLAGQQSRLSLEKRYLRADGQTVWVVLDVVLVRLADGEPDHFVAQVRDTTESRLQAEMLAHRAMHDPLTGLANRSLMHEVLQAAIERPGADGGVAVLVIDLDEFKQINDRYGHPAGDDVLVHVAGVLRAATGGRGTVARLGGDEFVVVVEDPDAARTVFEVAAGIHRGLRNPVRAQRRRLPVRASVGAAVADPGLLAGGVMGLLAAADAALYRAKAGGRGRTEVYDPSMSMAGAVRHGAAAELGQAIDAGQLVLHFQPVVDLEAGLVVGHEALVRWQHPERGLLLPGTFLATAEEAGLSVALGLDVARQAVAHLAATADRGHWVSINASAEQLADGELTGVVLAELARLGVAPGRLVVELTEASLVDAGTRIRHELSLLGQGGVPVLLDDFGTGVAPLSYLRDLPVTGVKLDMSFTAGIPEDPAAARVSRALGALAREMEMVTVAEGVETAEQAEFLRGCGWRYGQGWLFGAARSEPVVGVTDGRAP